MNPPPTYPSSISTTNPQACSSSNAPATSTTVLVMRELDRRTCNMRSFSEERGTGVGARGTGWMQLHRTRKEVGRRWRWLEGAGGGCN